MQLFVRWFYHRYSLLFLSIILQVASVDAADSGNKSRIKAAYIFNFIKFTEWPVDTHSDDINICVKNDNDLYSELEGLRKKRVRGMKIIVRKESSEFLNCQVVYLGELEGWQQDRLLLQFVGQPVLTIGDKNLFVEKGGVIQFFIESNRLRFEINTEVVDQSRLTISSKLLSLSRKATGARGK